LDQQEQLLTFINANNGEGQQRAEDKEAMGMAASAVRDQPPNKPSEQISKSKPRDKYNRIAEKIERIEQ